MPLAGEALGAAPGGAAQGAVPSGIESTDFDWLRTIGIMTFIAVYLVVSMSMVLHQCNKFKSLINNVEESDGRESKCRRQERGEGEEEDKEEVEEEKFSHTVITLEFDHEESDFV